MPPSSSDPKDLKLVLNPARQHALSVLVGSIVTYMRSKVEESFDISNDKTAPLFIDENAKTNSGLQDTSDIENVEYKERQARLEARLEQTPSNVKLNALKKAALNYFDGWQDSVMLELGKILNTPEDSRSDKRRREYQATKSLVPPPYTATAEEDSHSAPSASGVNLSGLSEAEDIGLLHKLYHPTPTRLTTISKEDRIAVISCILLMVLSLGNYSAHSRALLCYLTSSFELPLAVLSTEETEVSRTLLLASKELSADAETQKRQKQNQTARRWKVGLAGVAGAAIVGITGGLAAPVVAGAIGGIMSTVGLGGIASFLGVFAMNGALMGSLFGALGAGMTGSMVDQYAKDVEDFKFIPIKGEVGEQATRGEDEIEGRRLRVTIGISGWLNSMDDVVKPWRTLGHDSEVFALRYELEALLELGKSLKNMVSSYSWSFVKVEILKRTVFATLMSALWPVYLLKMATSIDNPFSVARNRSEKAGIVLADALINKTQGERPVTLVGYSLGSRVIYSCLRSLAERQAFGLIESVVLIGSPIPSNTSNWVVMRSVVSGKIINVYSENDYILAFIYRATSIQLGIAGLQEISTVEGVDNLNLSKEVSGHLRYPNLIGKILRKAGFSDVQIADEEIEEEPIEDVIPTGANIPMNQTERMETLGEAAPMYEREDKSMVDRVGQGVGHLGLGDAADDSEHPGTHMQDDDEDDEREHPGIHMLDDDKQEQPDMKEIPAEPARDPQLATTLPSIKSQPREVHDDGMFEEPKSLGFFPKAQAAKSASPESS